jgi:tRNA(adenine34) deaminase
MMAQPPSVLDREMMARSIALAREAGSAGEYPYGADIARNGQVVAAAPNRVTRDGDVTRHAEVVAISAAQKALGSVSLDDCTLYANAEPCVFCSYAIRESRIGRVVYALQSPHMGGRSKWDVLGDEDLSRRMPEVFTPPPEVVAGFMAREAEQALIAWNPLIAKFIKARGLFVSSPEESAAASLPPRRNGALQRVMRFLRCNLFDRFGRR